MASAKELTGGTGDVNPQILSATGSQSAADTFTTVEIPLPIPRPAARKGKSIVMEILGVKYQLGDLVVPAGQINITPFLATSSSASTIGDPTTFSWISRDGLFSTAIGFAYSSRKFDDNLSDGAGHGFLVATDSIFLSISSALTGAINRVNVKIHYRFKEITLEEYIGIVQGQQ